MKLSAGMPGELASAPPLFGPFAGPDDDARNIAAREPGGGVTAGPAFGTIGLAMRCGGCC